MTDEYANQPSISDWKFIDQLKSPLHTSINWRRLKKGKDEASLLDGVTLDFRFPDPEGRLDTTRADFEQFLRAGKISLGGKYKIVTEKAPTSCFEEYVLEVGEDECRILADDTEGIRRGLVFLEDRVTSTGGPFAKLGKTTRRPFVKTRVSRCFFGPIKRPPLNRDELMDDVNYYPDEYLNRLAHEGINGLWLSIEFRDLCPSRFFPEHGKDAGQRLAKLRDTVRQCARYGIKIYVYCNEPLGFGNAHYTLPLSELEGNPWFKGHTEEGGAWVYFCTSTKEGQEYLEDCTSHIFKNVPGLGGMISITHGERPTNCYSYAHTFFRSNCPRCSKRKPYEVYHDTLSAIVRGIKKAAPEAEFISWLYTPVLRTDHYSTMEQKFEVFRQIAAHTPKDVVMQMNFESNSVERQLGRDFMAYDYWLSWPGPSDIFRDCAKNAAAAEARTSAKIQVGCSHENAAIPFMPVPGSLHRKYSAMRELGVSSVMQCWYFGSYPGLMNKAAGELAFEPFPENETDFLKELARPDWSGDEDKVAEAWRLFMDGYSNFPITLSFTWFGPLHCSVAWPLHLLPSDTPIAPSWEFGYPDSGDRIGECICFQHSFEEVLELLGKMDESWQKGVRILESIEKNYESDDARRMDIALSKAVGLQIKCSKNVFTFYHIREKLPFLGRKEQLEALSAMRAIAEEEARNSRAMRELCLMDPRLGFHSEAEGYKFFPVKLEWRAGLIDKMLAEDFPKVQADIEKGAAIFPEHTGAKPVGKTYQCGRDAAKASVAKFEDDSASWKAWNDGKALHFEARWKKRTDGNELMNVIIEPRRLWPFLRFELDAEGKQSSFNPGLGPEMEWSSSSRREGDTIISEFVIPWTSIPARDGDRPIRVNVCQTGVGSSYLAGWIKQNPLKGRLLFGTHNSADLGWFFQA